MNGGAAQGRSYNPFAACYFDPAGTEYIFPPGENIESLADRLESAHWRAELLGPHGAGKTTLLHTLRREADARGLRTALFRCSDVQRNLPCDFISHVILNHIVFLDGGERLRTGQMAILKLLCRLAARGLVMTTHAPQRWGERVEVRVREEEFAALVSRHCSPAQAAEALRQAPSARAAIEHLYDAHESAKTSGADWL